MPVYSISWPYCLYFREGEKEEMACQGALVLEKLVSGGYLSPEKIPPMKKKSEIWRKHDEVLENCICSDCPFTGHRPSPMTPIDHYC